MQEQEVAGARTINNISNRMSGSDAIVRSMSSTSSTSNNISNSSTAPALVHPLRRNDATTCDTRYPVVCELVCAQRRAFAATG